MWRISNPFIGYWMPKWIGKSLVWWLFEWVDRGFLFRVVLDVRKRKKNRLCWSMSFEQSADVNLLFAGFGWLGRCSRLGLWQDPKWWNMFAWNRTKVRAVEFLSSRHSMFRTLSNTFTRELRVLVNQLLSSDLTDQLITLITYLAVVRCRKVRVCDEDDDLSLYLLESLVTGRASFCR